MTEPCNPEERWVLARNEDPYLRCDSRPGLISLGFQVLGKSSDLFYVVVPPKGWTSESAGYWTFIRDELGEERIRQFSKSGYDRDAFLVFL